MVLQLRMAAAVGLELADKVFSPVAGYDELPEEQAKAFGEYKKEQEKESRAKAQQAARGGGGPVAEPVDIGAGVTTATSRTSFRSSMGSR